MNRVEAEAIIADEALGRFVRFGVPDGTAADKACLFDVDGAWITLMTDERAVVQERTVRRFAAESEALYDLIDALRVLQKAKGVRGAEAGRMLESDAARFIEAVGDLPPVALAGAFDRMLELRRSGGREASRALKPSVAENSAIDHAVRTALLPRVAELDDFRDHLHSDAISATTIAARAILKRDRLSVEHYRLLVEPFASVGVALPAVPDA
jgi:hypothetical protein